MSTETQRSPLTQAIFYTMQHNPDIFSSHTYKNGIHNFHILQVNDWENISVITKGISRYSKRCDTSISKEPGRCWGDFFPWIVLSNQHTGPCTYKSSPQITNLCTNISSHSLNFVICTLELLNLLHWMNNSCPQISESCTQTLPNYHPPFICPCSPDTLAVDDWIIPFYQTFGC